MKKKKIYGAPRGGRKAALKYTVSEPQSFYGSPEHLTFEKVWLMFQETNKQFKETDRKIKELSNLFTGQWGKLVEALMAPGCLKLFRDRGIDVMRCHPNVTVEKENRKLLEIDLLLINTGEIVVEEIKTTARKKDIDEHLDRIKKFKGFYPEYKTWKVYGAIGALLYTENSDEYARENGFFVLKATGEGLVVMDNLPEFVPAVF